MSARTDALTSWHDDWSGLRVAVLGLGMTGFSVADTLAELRAELLVLAGAHDEDRERILDVLGVRYLIEPGLPEVPQELRKFAPELVIASPGFAPHHPIYAWAVEQGIPVWGDLELAWRLRDKTGTAPKWLAVTGTNGKTTTTQLAAYMALADGLRAAPCGNIGVPILDAIRDPEGFDVLVVECSSYQLHSTHTMAPDAAVVTNIADDHLDWHGNAEAYRRAKGRVYERTKTACVYNLADEATRRLVEDADVEEGCRAIGVGLGVPSPSDFGVVDGVLVDRAFLESRRTSALEIGTIEQLATRRMLAPHLVFDVLAAAALVRAIGVSPEAVARAIDTFQVDPHRNQFVRELNGVEWIDDSKATNPHAAAASLGAREHVVWIVGGLLKGVDIAPLVRDHAKRLRAAIVIGRDRREVLAAFEQHASEVPLVEIQVDETEAVMLQAVAHAARLAQAGDTVLLAPAAASMDQFKSYSDRGEHFAEAVHNLGEAPHVEASTEDGNDSTDER